ncbi:YjiH family protein [Ferrimonas balearica]|uniref:YjiH family protein n=1 Tax=Ferrimonas balearica TaxID=44012 RepID=UPI001C98F371|nr:YjiH family protein [Ferrimonas balearica]MBY5920698.1 YjiH family protein [Ferrimonas balearica]MBY5996617.1 YjiH family protein [Ferrimonas balearica]
MFLLPSLIGVFLFMTPVSVNGNLTIPVAVLAKGLLAEMDSFGVTLVTTVIVFSAVMTLVTKLVKPGVIVNHPFMNSLFNVTPAWAVTRVVGAVFVILTFFTVGPEAIHSGNTGGLVLNDLAPLLFCVFLFAGLFLPLLVNFGLLEMVGTTMTKLMRPLFNLPGRSAVDCFASWVGDGSVGVLMTSKQYEQGHYTEREAAVIGTTFSIVSITFSLVVIGTVGLEAYFLPFFGTVCLAGIVVAIVVPRLPPLSNKKDQFVDGRTRTGDEEVIPAGETTLSFGYKLALARASKVKSMGDVAREGVHNAADMILGVLPVVMAIGTAGLMVAEYTPLFAMLGKPFVPLLELLQIPDAAAASQTMVVGFADMFLPAILAEGINSEMTRFVIAALSVTQLIYMSEIGALLLGSKVPVKLWELFIIFLLRTLVALPVIAGMAHLIF